MGPRNLTNYKQDMPRKQRRLALFGGGCRAPERRGDPLHGPEDLPRLPQFPDGSDPGALPAIRRRTGPAALEDQAGEQHQGKMQSEQQKAEIAAGKAEQDGMKSQQYMANTDEAHQMKMAQGRQAMALKERAANQKPNQER